MEGERRRWQGMELNWVLSTNDFYRFMPEFVIFNTVDHKLRIVHKPQPPAGPLGSKCGLRL